MDFGVEVGRFRFPKDRDSDSLVIFGTFWMNWNQNLNQRNRKRYQGIIFQFTIPHFTIRWKESRFTIPDFEESTHLYFGVSCHLCHLGKWVSLHVFHSAGLDGAVVLLRLLFLARPCHHTFTFYLSLLLTKDTLETAYKVA